MNIFDKIKNFFKEDFSEVVGVYYNGEKIFLAHITHKIELEEINFEIDFTENISPTEQLAEKIFMILNQRGWQNSKIGLCLNDDDAIILKTSFDNVPENEIDSAVKTWAITKSDKNAAYAFIKIDENIWAETLSETLLNDYISAYQKNSLNLCALSVMPTPEDDNDKAIFIAEVLNEKKPPNLIKNNPDVYNHKKIFLAVAGIFLFVHILFSIKLFYDYKIAENNLRAINKILSADSQSLVIKKNFDKIISDLKILNAMMYSQADKFAKLNAMIRLGEIYDSASIKKISANKNFMQVDGVADKIENVEKIQRIFDNSVVENSANVDGEIIFTIKIF